MAEWKKVVVSGSAISQLDNDSNYVSATGTGLVSGSAQIDGTGIINNTVGFGGVSVALGSEDATPAFDLSDASGLPIVNGTTGTLSVARGGTGATSFTAGNLLVGANTQAVTAARAIGIANNNIPDIDAADVADNDYARFTASGLEGRSASEVFADITSGTGTISGSAQIEGNFLEVTGDNVVSGSAQIDGASLGSNNSISMGGVTVVLGGDDATPAFDLSDATSLPIVAGTTGTLSVARGGTGVTSLTAGQVMIGANTQAVTTRAFGIADNNVVAIDSTTVADNEYARFTANGLESRTAGEVFSDITAGTGVISGSAGLPNLAGDVTGTIGSNTVGKIQGVAITSGEATQIANIGSTTISAAQWGYLGGLTATNTELNQLDGVTVGGTTAGDIVTIDGTQTLTNKTIAASQVTEISNLTAAEGAQLENINSVTISNTQWGYLGAMDQGVTTTSNVNFGNLTLSGNLTVQGTTTSIETTNLAVDDKMILLNSGSAAGDSGIIFGGTLGTANRGMALMLDDSDDRLVLQTTDVLADATAFVPATTNHYSIVGAFEGTEGQATTAKANKVGNIRVEASEIYIYV